MTFSLDSMMHEGERMMTRLTWCLALAVLVASSGFAVAAVDNPTDQPKTVEKVKPAEKTDDAVVKVLETPKQGAAVLKIAPPVGPGTDTIAIPAMNDPDPVLMDLLLNARRGSLLELKTNLVNGKRTLVSATAYKMKAGEDEPNVYVFSKRTTYRLSGVDVPALDVTKFIKPTVLVLPFTKDKDGKVTPNADMLHALETLKDGDSVEAITLPSAIKPGVYTLKSLKPYVPWEKAQFSKLGKKKFQTDDLTTLEVLDDGENLVMLITAKDEAVITGIVNKIKHGDNLLYRSKTTDDVIWVTEVKPIVPEVVKPDNTGPKRIVGIPPARHPRGHH
jgi:hypothetical protein